MNKCFISKDINTMEAESIWWKRNFPENFKEDLIVFIHFVLLIHMDFKILLT